MRKIGFILFVALVALSSCGRERKIKRTDTQTSGVAQVAVDECLAPIIQLQIDVFHQMNIDATILPVYTSEKEAYDLFLKDSIRVLVGTRPLTKNEEEYIAQTHKLDFRKKKLAVDGVALIVNKTNMDSLLSISDLTSIFTGDKSTWKELNANSKLGNIDVVFDSPNSSTARYIKDEICEGKPFGANVRALSIDSTFADNIKKDRTPNQKVIDYVATTPNALGIIGVNWISNPKDSTSLSFVDKIKVVAISQEEIATFENSYLPFPYQLALDKYPLKRDVYVMLTDLMGGLPSGFYRFSLGDIGQRIITKAGMLPGNRPMRMIQVSSHF